MFAQFTPFIFGDMCRGDKRVGYMVGWVIMNRGNCGILASIRFRVEKSSLSPKTLWAAS